MLASSTRLDHLGLPQNQDDAARDYIIGISVLPLLGDVFN